MPGASLRHLPRTASARAGRLLAAGLALACLALGPAGQPPPTSADCGGFGREVVFGELDWESAQVATWIARLVLEHGFGCETSSIFGTVVPIYQGAVRGDVDVVMEVWTDNVPDLWTEALAAGAVAHAGVVFDDAEQGWFVPRYLVEGDPERGIAPAAPDLRSVADLERHADLFRDPEFPDRGRFHNCPIGWQCELLNSVKLHAYGLADSYTDFRAGTGAALAASLEAAYLRGDPWLGYQWGPTWVLGELDLFMLDEPAHEAGCWEELTSWVDDPQGATVACAYPTSTAVVALGSRFKDGAPEAVAVFLNAYRGSSGMLSRALAYMHQHDVGAREAAAQFLRSEEDVWRPWLPQEVADRVAAGVGS